MTTSQLKAFLGSIGLPEKESSVYIVLLSMGKGTVSTIARRAGLNRTTGYDVLDSLTSKRLVSISGKEPKQEYVAESPDAIMEFVKKRRQEADEQLEEVQKILPELKGMYTVRGRPQVRFYEGLKGLEQVYEDTLTSHEPIRAYAEVGNIHATLPHYFPLYYKRRAKKGIPIRAIFPNTPDSIALTAHDMGELRETALVPADQYNFSPEINIYDNKVMITSWREKLGITIESAEIADAMKKIFELAWKEAKRLDAQIRQPQRQPQ
ncbi:hypothetical protein HZA86_02750 [Candidatus Uhrbacteria bacterium]|nr:hypothetical protein [Candidatus Uhrbacteria bacterium]